MSNSTNQKLVRPMRYEDLEIVLAWRNHPEIRRFMYTQQEISLSEHKSWFRRALRNRNKYLLIFEFHNIPRGFITFERTIDSKIADWGFYAAPDAPKGTGRQLARSALTYAFAQLKLHKICGQAIDYNERSIKFHLSLGFQQERILREQYFDGQSYHDVVCFGLLASEWPLND